LRLKREQARLAETALHRRADGADKEAEDRRKWNEALIRLQIAAQEKKMQSSAVKYEDVEKLNKLKEDLADLHSDTNEGVSRAA
jgi:outer membrane protein assembly factor BamD (BamD/ComL family)